jgi:epoxyqueuosine reductase
MRDPRTTTIEGVSDAAPGASSPPPPDLTEIVLATLRRNGLAAAGVAAAEPFVGTRDELHRRRRAGLHGGMRFTYRDPDRSTDPNRILEGARSLVVGALGYLRSDPPPPLGRPVAPGRVARYAWGDRYATLTAALDAGAVALRGAGYQAVVVADDNALVDREAAFRAGLGWYGRNANLLLEGRGSWFVLGSIVTDAVLRVSEPIAPGCGSCTRCVTGCPTGAIISPGVVDARRCLAWLLQDDGPFPRQHRVDLGDRLYGCDDCQEVCPPNIAAARHEHAPASSGDRAVLDATALLVDDDAAVLAAAGRWYVARRDARYLRRNALVVLGNAADPADPRVVGHLQRALRHADPLVRAHAVWAAARLGRPDLADELVETEADPMVRDELDRRGDVPTRSA